MTETERNQIKSALLKCAEENENKFTLTGHIVVSSLCKSAVERIAELEKENAEMKKQLTKAKEIIKDYLTIVKGSHTAVCGVSEENRTINVLKLNKEAEQFLNSEVEK